MFHFTTAGNRWLWRVGAAAGSMICALVLTHVFWRFLQYTPFLIGFAAAILSSRVGGRAAGFLAVGIGLVGYALFPPPLPEEELGRLLFGFAVVSGIFSWLVARRYEIEAALRSSQERLRAVLSSLPIMVWAIDRAGDVTLAEGSGLKVLNLSSRELVGRSVFELYRDHPDVLANTKRALEGETFTATFVLGDVAVETWYSPLRSDHGSVSGAIGVSLDVTTRRRLEQQYLQAQKMESVGQLAAGIAHDFSNLLVAIGGYAELVMESFDPADPRRSDLLEVRKAAERADALTRQLLAFSRRQVLHPKVIDLNLLVGEVQKLLRRTIAEHIDLVLDLDPVLDPIRADPTQIEQVLLNLAVNARDAMPAGGQLHLATENVNVDDGLAARRPPMTPGRYVRLTVRDTGTGMDEHVKAHLFEPFFTTKDRSKGTGLGLATVYGIVRQSGGFIWVDSRPGQGTVFDIYFPAIQGKVEAAARTDTGGSMTGGSETILLVEDDAAVRRLAREVLTRYGYTILEARDGEEALAIAEHHQSVIDLLITDVIMPGLGGRALAVKLIATRPAIRVLYTSGYAADLMLREELEGDLPFLAKSFLPSDLIRTVRGVLDAPIPPRS